MAHHGEATTIVEAAPDDVFATITDIERLPDWNAAIRAVRNAPAELTPGARWDVDIHASGFGTWPSTSEVVSIDRERRRFVYRSQSDDGNPSFADWEWSVRPAPGGALVHVRFELHPLTFGRKYVAVHLRKPQLVKELRTSLDALAAAVKVR